MLWTIFVVLLVLWLLGVVSAYTLGGFIHLLLIVAIAILCILAVRLPDNAQRILIPYFILYAAILTPESYVILHGARYGAQVRVLCLLGLLVLALRKPLPSEPAAP